MSIAVNPGVMAPPAANTFQPGSQNDRVGTSEQQPRAEQTQPRQAASAESRRGEDRMRDQSNDRMMTRVDSAPAESRADAVRGSVLDIEV